MYGNGGGGGFERVCPPKTGYTYIECAVGGGYFEVYLSALWIVLEGLRHLLHVLGLELDLDLLYGRDGFVYMFDSTRCGRISTGRTSIAMCELY